MPAWTKANPEDIDHFHKLAAAVEGVEVRKMFGFPAAFVAGNMAFGLFQDRLMLRLPAQDREELLAIGWQQFEPMPGRPMREYLTPPSDVTADPAKTRSWLQRAATYAAGLPPKSPKSKRPSSR